MQVNLGWKLQYNAHFFYFIFTNCCGFFGFASSVIKPRTCSVYRVWSRIEIHITIRRKQLLLVVNTWSRVIPYYCIQGSMWTRLNWNKSFYISKSDSKTAFWPFGILMLWCSSLIKQFKTTVYQVYVALRDLFEKYMITTRNVPSHKTDTNLKIL